MKKIIRTIFVLVLSLVTVALTACEEKPDFTASDVIKVLLVEQESYVTDDFVVPGVIKHKGVEYGLQWTSDNNCLAVAAEKDSNNNYKISVTRPDEYQGVKLTASLTIGKTNATKEFEFHIYPVDVYELSEAYKFVYNKKTASESFNLDTTYTLHGKTATIAWAIKAGSEGKYTIENGNKVVFDTPTKNIPVEIVATFTYGGMSTPMNYSFTLVPPTTVQSIKDGDTYKFSVYQANLGKTIYFKGELSSDGKYLASSDKVADAVDVTVHEVNGGYTLSFVDADNKTKYIDIAKSGTYINAVIADQPSSPFEFNKEYYTFTKNIDNTDYYIGTYNSYETLSASKLSYAATSFVCVLSDISKLPAAPDAPEEPKAITSIAEALAATDGAEVELTGTVVAAEAWSTQYKSMGVTIADAEGNMIYAFSMKTAVKVGDVITITGKKGSNYGDPQIASGATAVIVTPAPAVDTTAYVSLSFGDAANRESQSSSQQVWKQNGITLTNDKSSSTTNVADKVGPARFFKSSKITIECEQSFTKVVLWCSQPEYFAEGIEVTGATVTTKDLCIIITFETPVSSFEITSLPGQLRLNTLDVYPAAQ